MYTENLPRDVLRFAKACASNLVARWAPAAYVRLTQQTGRGADDDTPEQIADYFFRCFDDYRVRLGLEPPAFADFLQGKRVLEYGPGDVLGTALLLYAHGAVSVHCVDRFPLQNVSSKNALVYLALLKRLPAAIRERATQAFEVPGDPKSGLRRQCIDYQVTPDGLAGRPAAYDFIVSRAVLEHVNSLPATLNDVAAGLAPGGLSIHNVDLRSHNLDRYRPFDFLTWPEPLYRLMYSHKGFPNRWRPDAYRSILSRTHLKVVAMQPTGLLAAEDVARIRLKVAGRFRNTSAEDLSWLGFWVVLQQPLRT
jgi:hypothetical protein